MPRPISILRTLPPDARIQAIAQTIEIASDTERDHLAVELIELAAPRPRPPSRSARSLLETLRDWINRHPDDGVATAEAALHHLARLWPCLSADARSAALAVGQGRWHPAIEAAAGHPSPAIRQSAAHLATDLADPALGPLIARLVADPLDPVADAAEAALVSLAAHAAALPPAPADARVLGNAVAALLRTYDRHRRRGVLLAATWLLDARGISEAAPSKAMRDWFNEADDPAHLAFRSLIRRAPEPFVLDRAWRWLATPAVARPSLDRVAAVAPDDLPRLLEQSHLLAHPRRAALLRSARPARRAAGGGPAPFSLVPTDASPLSTTARRGLPRWLATLNLPERAREEATAPLLADPDPVVRHAAARTASSAALPDFAFDADEPVARHAALRLIADRPAAAPCLPSLLRSPHARVRSLAAEELDAASPWNPASPSSRLAARRLLAADRAAFVGRLQHRVMTGPVGDRTDAILLAHALGLAPDVELELLTTLRELDHAPADEALAHPAAAAVTALGRISAESARAAISACLAHPHDRVRANAVEAARRLLLPPAGAAFPSQLLKLKDDPHHRVRANTLRVLLSVGPSEQGEPMLAAMLADDRPMHRVAGLWLLERSLAAPADAPSARRWSALAARVAEIARADPDPAARRRAIALSRRLLGQIRTGWRGRAPAVTPAPHAETDP